MTHTITYPLTFLIGAALLFTASIAYAEEDVATTNASVDASASVDVRLTPEERRDTMEDKREEKQETRKENIEVRQETRAEVRTAIEARRDALKARGLENATDRIAHNIKRYLALLEAGAERLTGLVARIEARAEVLAEAGADVSNVRVHVAAAETAIASVYIKIDDIKGEAEAVTPDTARDVFQKIRASLSDAKGLLKDAAGSVRAAVTALKEAAAALDDDSDGDSIDTSTDVEADVQ